MDEEVLGNRKVLEKHDAQDRKELWFGKQALTKGLVDEIGSYEAVSDASII
jgi:ClpP class serine protease